MQEQTPSPEDAEKRRQILERLGAIVAAGLDGHIGLRVEPYGSFVSGLYCPTGDLDISIEGHVSTRWGAKVLGTSQVSTEHWRNHKSS